MNANARSHGPVSPFAIGAVLFVLIVAGIAYLLRPQKANEPEALPEGTIYYTGPMKGKGSGSFGYENGTAVPDSMIPKP